MTVVVPNVIQRSIATIRLTLDLDYFDFGGAEGDRTPDLLIKHFEVLTDTSLSLGAAAVLNHSAIALLQLSGGFEMRRLALVSVIITFLSACGSATQNPNVNQTPVPTPDLTGRFVEVPTNQPFKYSVVAAGLLKVGGGLTSVTSTGAIGPSYNNLRVLQKLNLGNFIVTYDGYAQPDDNSNVIVKALAEGVNQGDGPYVVSFRSFSPLGISLRVHDLSANGPPSDFKEVKVMLEISRYVRTN